MSKKSKDFIKKSLKPKKPSKSIRTRLEIIDYVSKKAGIRKYRVIKALEALQEIMHVNIGKSGPGKFAIPVLGIKIYRVEKPAKKARKFFSPLVKTEVMVPAKPKRMILKAKFFKSLRKAVNK